PRSHPASSRPSVTRPSHRAPEPTDFGLSDLPQSQEPAVSEPAVSGERAIRDKEPQPSLILPRLPEDFEHGTGSEPDSARERFRRAAEIGAKARLDAREKKKG